MLILHLFNEHREWEGNSPAFLWEANMREPWSDYTAADKFIVVDGADIVGGFAIYWDESDDVAGHFMSGWAARHRGVPVADIINRAVENVGDLFFKTDQRTAKILLEKIGKKVKKTDRFVYYVIRGNKNGKTKKR